MKLPSAEHTTRPWRIHEIAPDFELEDVWGLPTPGGPDDFPLLVRGLTSLDLAGGSSPIVRFLVAARQQLGELFGWDAPEGGLGSRVQSLRDRLPEDLRDSTTGAEFENLPAEPVYLTDNEFVAEVANKTVHGVLHLAWVEDGYGAYRGQLAVLVKRNGLLGAAYMKAITPFRYALVYPMMMRDIERSWTALRTLERARRDPAR